MNALAIVFAGRLSAQAFEPLMNGSSALCLAMERIQAFPEVKKTVLLVPETWNISIEAPSLTLVREKDWDVGTLLRTMASLSESYDFLYYAWADCPLLDPALADALRDRHQRYAAEYTYADGWPYGFAPELLASGTAALLSKLWGEAKGKVERDTLFHVIQKDINSFDIETEISPVDLRPHRLSFAANSKRELLLLQSFMKSGLRTASEAAAMIAAHPEQLRTLPSFYQIQVVGACLQSCGFCPYPHFGAACGKDILQRDDFMDADHFESLMDRIIDFSGDGVIDISVWGEVSLHPRVERLIQAILARPELTAIIETSGLGWKDEFLDTLASQAATAAPRINGKSALSWIVSLDTDDPQRYATLRGKGFNEAKACAQALITRFPEDAYVQALRFVNHEEDLERFYRSWKGKTSKIIVQKHDDFCAYLPSLKAGDISPIHRHPCWHLMRDLAILLDGTVPFCREAVERPRILGNVFETSLAELWAQNNELYLDHCAGIYPGCCAGCDEYYTYNF